MTEPQPLITRDPVAYADHFLDLMMPRGESNWPGTISTIRALQTEVKRLRHALTNVADNLHGVGLISDVAKADILREVAGSATPTEEDGT